MSYRRSAVVLLTVTLFATGCSWWRKRDVESCAKLASRPDAPFDAGNAGSMIGRYQLVMISESSSEFSHSDRGQLELFTSSGNGSQVLWGAADMTPHELTIPWVYNPSSRDPNRPGVRVYANGDADFGGRRDDGSPGVSMHIESVSRDGFGGTWTGVPLGVLPVEPNGKPVPAPHGRFCALRRG